MKPTELEAITEYAKKYDLIPQLSLPPHKIAFKKKGTGNNLEVSMAVILHDLEWQINPKTESIIKLKNK